MSIKSLAEAFSESMNKGIGDLVTLLYKSIPDLNDEKNFEEFCKVRAEYRKTMCGNHVPPADKGNIHLGKSMPVDFNNEPQRTNSFVDDLPETAEEIEKIYELLSQPKKRTKD